MYRSIPLWIDVGYLHALAAASAVRSNLSFELDIPVRYGTAVLPTVGSASLPPDTSHVRVRAGNGGVGLYTGSVTVRAVAGDPAWHEPITVTVNTDGIDLQIELLDRDMYRDLRGPSPPRPLSTPEITRWRTRLEEAWAVLVREQRDRARAVASGLRMLAPIPAMERFRQLSASGAEAFGGVLLSEPDDATQLAATLVHESQHQKLGALLHLLTLCKETPNVRYYAPWRDDPRPVTGLLQGSYAFAGVTDFWRAHRRYARPDEAAIANFEFALWRRQTLKALWVLAVCGRLTDHGQRFVDTLRGTLERCRDDPVPALELAAADGVALDHWAMWRGNNLRLDRAVEAQLATAWERGDSVPPAVDGAEDAPKAVAKPDAGWFDSRAVLVRYRLANSEAFERLCASPDKVAERVAGATPADLALVAGNVSQARVSYLRELVAEPFNVHGWVGLGLTQADRTTDPATRALLRRPELILAAMRGLAARDALRAVPDPIELATWIGCSISDHDFDAIEPAGWLVA